MTAPRIGPHMSSHAIGGPAWSSRRSSSSCRAARRPRGPRRPSAGATASIRSSASALAASMRSSAIRAGEAPAERVVAVGRRAPVEADDVRAVRGGRLGEAVDADVDEGGRPVEQASERGHAATSAGIRVSASAAAALLEPASTAPASRSAALLARGGPGDRRRCRTTKHTTCGASSRAVISAITGARSPAGSVGGEVAEHDVEHDHGGPRVVARRAEHVEAHGRVDHRVRAPDGEAVVAEVEDEVRVGSRAGRSAARRVASSVDLARARGASSRLGLVGERPAGVEAAQQAARAARRGGVAPGAAAPAGAPRRRRRARRAAARPPRASRPSCTPSGAPSGSAPRKRPRPACRSPPRAPSTRSATSGSGGFETRPSTFVAGSAASASMASSIEIGADRGAEVVPADADHLARRPRPSRRSGSDLLQPGAGRADQADLARRGPRWRSRAARRRRSRCRSPGPMTIRPRACAARLSSISCVERDVVAEEEDVEPEARAP